MSVPTHLRYTEEHEWLADRGDDLVRIGITRHAADALGDIVYVQLPEVGDQVEAGQPCGELESTKSVSDLFAPVTGEVVATNQAVVDDPGLVNSEPFEGGWLLEVRATATGAVLTADQYAALIEG
ncbi:glycine cleavage system H protein [Saccharopolyspora subtropica]|uniref:Glycine cleavage system H protein n=1 Tax=Saccharopolyspora thermophila TaxID=89367 RepID=A0A917NIM5_9PSEU|nr:glycine cleavage system protein GcvH [Saccharopolyspora subtropica]GGJ04073.1 glycine cleavage system H protein [Saccharopolyspora subtropica]